MYIYILSIIVVVACVILVGLVMTGVKPVLMNFLMRSKVLLWVKGVSFCSYLMNHINV